MNNSWNLMDLENIDIGMSFFFQGEGRGVVFCHFVSCVVVFPFLFVACDVRSVFLKLGKDHDSSFKSNNNNFILGVTFFVF